MPNVALTVVSNNEKNLKRFAALWKDHGDHDDLVVMHDRDHLPDVEAGHLVSRHEARDAGFEGIIPFSGPTARAFAFYEAVRRGADYVVSLDDDCLPRPYDPPFCQSYMKEMQLPRWDWLITGQRTRGIPITVEHNVQSVFHVGLWSGLADLDSRQIEAGQRTVALPTQSRVIPRGQYFPWSSGNTCFHKSLLPLMLLPDMGPKSPYIRFDDIWTGIIVKRVLDHLELTASVGLPFVEHYSEVKAAASRLEREDAGAGVNDRFWKRIDSIEITGNSIADCGLQIADALRDWNDLSLSYFRCFGKQMELWISKVQEISLS